MEDDTPASIWPSANWSDTASPAAIAAASPAPMPVAPGLGGFFNMLGGMLGIGQPAQGPGGAMAEATHANDPNGMQAQSPPALFNAPQSNQPIGGIGPFPGFGAPQPGQPQANTAPGQPPGSGMQPLGMGGMLSGFRNFGNQISMALTGMPSPGYMRGVERQKQILQTQIEQQKLQGDAFRNQQEQAITYANSAARATDEQQAGLAPQGPILSDPQKVAQLRQAAMAGNPRAYAALPKPEQDAVTADAMSAYPAFRDDFATALDRATNARSDAEFKAALGMTDWSSHGIADPSQFFGKSLADFSQRAPALRGALGQWDAQHQAYLRQSDSLDQFALPSTDYTKSLTVGAKDSFRIGSSTVDLPVLANPRTGEVAVNLGQAVANGQAIGGPATVKDLRSSVDSETKQLMSVRGDVTRLQDYFDAAPDGSVSIKPEYNNAAGLQHITDTLAKIGAGGKATKWNSELFDSGLSLTTRLEKIVGTWTQGRPIPNDLAADLSKFIPAARNGLDNEIGDRIGPVMQQAGELNVRPDSLVPAWAMSLPGVADAFGQGHQSLKQVLDQTKSGLWIQGTRYDPNGNPVSSSKLTTGAKGYLDQATAARQAPQGQPQAQSSAPRPQGPTAPPSPPATSPAAPQGPQPGALSQAPEAVAYRNNVALAARANNLPPNIAGVGARIYDGSSVEPKDAGVALYEAVKRRDPAVLAAAQSPTPENIAAARQALGIGLQPTQQAPAAQPPGQQAPQQPPTMAGAPLPSSLSSTPQPAQGVGMPQGNRAKYLDVNADVGHSPEYYLASGPVAGVESSNGRNLGSRGSIFQFGHAEQAQYGIRPGDVASEEAGMKRYTGDHDAALRASGVPVNDVTGYAAHQQGVNGAAALYKALQTNPNAPAAQYVPAANAAGNRAFFMNADGSPKTVAQFWAMAADRMGGHGAPVAASRHLPTMAQPGTPEGALAAQPNFVPGVGSQVAPGVFATPAQMLGNPNDETGRNAIAARAGQPPRMPVEQPAAQNANPVDDRAVGQRVADLTSSGMPLEQALAQARQEQEQGAVTAAQHTPAADFRAAFAKSYPGRTEQPSESELASGAQQQVGERLAGSIRTVDDFMRAGGSTLGADYVAAAANTWGPGGNGKSFADNLAAEKASNAEAAQRSPIATTLGHVAGQTAGLLSPAGAVEGLGGIAARAGIMGLQSAASAPKADVGNAVAHGVIGAAAGVFGEGVGGLVGAGARAVLAKAPWLKDLTAGAQEKLLEAGRTLAQQTDGKPAAEARDIVQSYGLTEGDAIRLAVAQDAKQPVTRGSLAEQGAETSVPALQSAAGAKPNEGALQKAVRTAEGRVQQGYANVELHENSLQYQPPADLVPVSARASKMVQQLQREGFNEASDPTVAKAMARLQAVADDVATVPTAEQLVGTAASLRTLKSELGAQADQATGKTAAGLGKLSSAANDLWADTMTRALGSDRGRAVVGALYKNDAAFADLRTAFAGRDGGEILDALTAGRGDISIGKFIAESSRLNGVNKGGIKAIQAFKNIVGNDPMATDALKAEVLRGVVGDAATGDQVKANVNAFLTGPREAVAKTLFSEAEIKRLQAAVNGPIFGASKFGAVKSLHEASKLGDTGEATVAPMVAGELATHVVGHTVGGLAGLGVGGITLARGVRNWWLARRAGQQIAFSDVVREEAARRIGRGAALATDAAERKVLEGVR